MVARTKNVRVQVILVVTFVRTHQHPVVSILLSSPEPQRCKGRILVLTIPRTIHAVGVGHTLDPQGRN